MHNWQRFVSLVMVCFICSGVLCGGASAVDDDVSTFGLIVDKSAYCSWNDINWSSSTDSGVMPSGVATLPSSNSSDYQQVWTGRQVDFIGNDSKHVNFEMGTWTVATGTWTEGIASVSGLFTFEMIFAGTGGNDFWSTSDKWGFGPLSWTFTVVTNAKTYTQSGRGHRASIDITFDGIEQVRGMTFQFEFSPYVTVDFEKLGWKSNAAFLWIQTSTSIRMNPYDASGEYMDDVVSGINEGNSLLSGILGGISDLWDAITSLPGKIADAIKGLFVPTDAQIKELKTGFNNLLETKLGFVYQAASLVDGVVVAVFDACDNPDSDVAFTIPAFPAFEVSGERVSLWDEPITVDLSDNEVVSTIQTAAGPFVVAVLVLAFAHSMENAFYAFVGGQTLIEWIRGRHDGA